MIWATSQLFIIVILEAIIAKVHSDYHTELNNVNQEPLDAAAKQLLKEVVANARAMTIYHALFIIAQPFQWFLAADAVRDR